MKSALLLYAEKVTSLRLQPTGYSTFKKVAGPSVYLWARFWIATGLKSEDIQKYGFYNPTDTINHPYFNRCLAADTNWITVHSRNKLFTQVGAALFILFLALSALLLINHAGWVLLELFLFWGWFGYEIWISNKNSGYVSPDPNFSQPMNSVKHLAVMSLIPLSALLFIGCFHTYITNDKILFFVPAMLVSVCGMSAGLLRLLRASSNNHEVTCKKCDRAMQQLTATQIKAHLTSSEISTLHSHLGAYEGWCCSSCTPSATGDEKSREEESSEKESVLKRTDFHLLAFKFPRDKLRYKPKRSTSTYHDFGDSSYGSGSSSSSGGSSSGGSSWGGSFGGGDSGGGGAGDSW